MIDFMVENYPIYGAAWCAEKLSIPHEKVIFFANHKRILLSKESTKQIVGSKAAEYMRENNPSKLPGATARLRAAALSRPDVIEKLMLGSAKMQKEKPSGLEKRLHKILADLGVSFEYAVILKPKFVVDVRIGRLIIEADGEYWHGHPRYEPLTERQERQQARDTARNKYLAACGYFVERIWDRDVTIENVTAILKKHNII
jgi:very-short-patch-repair endonuclease